MKKKEVDIKTLERLVDQKKLMENWCPKDKSSIITYCAYYKTDKCKYTCNYARRN